MSDWIKYEHLGAAPHLPAELAKMVGEANESISRFMLGSSPLGEPGGSYAQGIAHREMLRQAIGRKQAAEDWARLSELFGQTFLWPLKRLGSRPGTSYYTRRCLYWRRKANRLQTRSRR